MRMEPGGEGVGVGGAGKTPPVAGLVGMALPKSARFFDLGHRLHLRRVAAQRRREYAADITANSMLTSKSISLHVKCEKRQRSPLYNLMSPERQRREIRCLISSDPPATIR